MKLLILALDGFDPHLFSLWRDHLPHLSRLAQNGAWGPAISVTPPMTFPAWSSFLTGANPGQHGIFDFTERQPNRLAVRFLNATRRRLPTFLRLASEAGYKVGSVGLPTTYPPERLSGYQISGFDTPVPSKADHSYVHPPELADKIDRELGGYYFGDFNESRIGIKWHGQTLEKLLNGMRSKVELARFLQREIPVDLMLLHVGETDTVGHHFWAFHDRHSPRFIQPSESRLSTAVLNVYQAADDLVGQMLEIAQPEATMIISDHGMGGTSDRVLYLNRYLESCGLLRFDPSAVGSPWIGKLKTWGLRWTPYRLQQQVFKLAGGKLASRIESLQRFSGINWSLTSAYSEELNYFPALWLNRVGREPAGIVQPENAASTANQVMAALMDWRDPLTSEPVVRNIHRREEIYQGSEVPFAPDLILELNQPDGYNYALGRSLSRDGYSPWRRLRSDEYLGCKGASMNGSHRKEGIFIMAGQNQPIFLPQDLYLSEVAPLVLQILGLEVPDWMKKPGIPVYRKLKSSDNLMQQFQYDPAQEERLRRRLTGLGYL
jgi:predicted AlkP superfamily phosphohydrolase/phosphomutase